MESKGTTVVASCIHQALTDSHRYTTLTDATSRFSVSPIISPQTVQLSLMSGAQCISPISNLLDQWVSVIIFLKLLYTVHIPSAVAQQLARDMLVPYASRQTVFNS